MIDPNTITLFEQTGVGNMGDVTDKASIARFSLPSASRYVLATIRGLFTLGTGKANMVMRTDHRRGPPFDFHNQTFEDMGTDGDAILEYRVPEDEIFHHLYVKDFATGKQDALVLTWTNPDSGTMRWAIEVGLINVASLTP